MFVDLWDEQDALVDVYKLEIFYKLNGLDADSEIDRIL